MDRDSPYYRQVQLLVRVLPFIFQEQCFALKGGTAINLFVRDFPRLSVDIDLVYLGNEERQSALVIIQQALDRIAMVIKKALSGVSIDKSYERKPDALRLVINHRGASIKVELSPVLRGVLHPPQTRAVVMSVEQQFGFAEVPVVALEDLYAGKICAAFDRQHPRDFFDLLLLLENEGISDSLRKAFLVYLVSHPRPMEELLEPRWQPLGAAFENEFKGMAFRRVSVEALEDAGKQALRIVLSTLTSQEKQFLIGLYQRSPDWAALGLDGASNLPAVRWKLSNIAKMPDRKRDASLAALRRVLGVNE